MAEQYKADNLLDLMESQFGHLHYNDRYGGCHAGTWVEDVLSAEGRFQLPGKKALQEEEPKTVAIDVMEHPIERPKKQEAYYSGKKKRHTILTAPINSCRFLR